MKEVVRCGGGGGGDWGDGERADDVGESEGGAPRPHHHLDERREKQWVGENGGRGRVGGGEIRERGA